MADINKRLNLIKGDVSAIGAAEKLKTTVEAAGKSVRNAFKNTPTSLQDRLKDVTAEAKDASSALEQLRKDAIAALDVPVASANRGNDRDLYRDSFGDISSATSALQSVGGGEASGLISDVTGFIEYAPRLGESISDIARRSVDGSSLLSTAATALTPIMGGAAAAIATVTTVAIPVAALLGAVAVAWGNLNSTIEQGKVQLKGALEAQKNYYDLLGSGTTEDAAAALEQANKDLETLQARRNEIINAQSKGFEFAQQQYGDGLARLIISVGQGRGAFEDLDSELKDIDSQIATNQQTISRLNVGLEDNAFAANDMAASLETLTTTQQEYQTALDTSQQSIQNYTDQINQLNETFTTNNVRNAVDGIFKGIFDTTEAVISAAEKAEDANIAREEREGAHQGRLKQIETQGIQTIEKLREDATQKALDTQKAISDLETQSRADEEKALEAFNERIRKIEADARRKRADAEQSMSDARLSFDALAFKKAQDEFDKAGRQEDKQKRRATREFDDDKAERNRVLAEKIAALNTELAAFQTNTQTKIDAELNAINERLLAEQAAFDASEKKLTEREDRIEQRAEARADRREAYEEALEARREQRAQTDHDKQIGRIESLRDEEVKRFDALTGELQQVDTEITRIGISAESVATAAAKMADAAERMENTPFGGATSTVSGEARDSGGTGVAGRPYLIGRDAQPELFIPSSSGRFIPNADRAFGGPTINVSNQGLFDGANIGENVSRKDLEKIKKYVDKSNEDLLMGIIEANLEAQKPVR